MKLAEQIYINGNIYTVNEEFPHAEAMACCDGKLLFVGSNDQALEYKGENTVVIDLEGKTVIPGILDNHVHPLTAGSMYYRVDCVGKSREEILAAVAEEAKKRKPGEWILGFGWDQSTWDDTTLPTRQELDAAAPDNYVRLIRICGHANWVSSNVLELAGVNKDTPNPAGGEFLRDENGDPTGFITEYACLAIENVVPDPSVDELRRYILTVQDRTLEYGITGMADKSIGSMIVGGVPQIDETIQIFRELGEADMLKLRYHIYMGTYDELERTYKDGWKEPDFDGKFIFCGTKVFSDGALGARSAWLLDSYEDRPGHTGEGNYSTEYMAMRIKQAHDAGYQVSVHAIGDAAVRQCLDAYEMANPNMEDWRFVVEHLMIVSPEDMERLKHMNLIASMQYVELSTDLKMVESRIGKERALGAYAWRDIMNAGIVIAAGTDHPMDSMNPYENMYYAVSRCTIDDYPAGGWHPSQALTRYEALKTYTLNSAYAVRREKELGSLEAGKYADFAVIDKDYMNCEVKEIKNIKVLMTVVGGKIVYKAE